VALMLEDRGLGAEPQRLQAAAGRVCREGKALAPVQGGTAKTPEMAQAVLKAYRDPLRKLSVKHPLQFRHRSDFHR
jgi:isocitrate/isopropylmalate dehydrogenase